MPKKAPVGGGGCRVTGTFCSPGGAPLAGRVVSLRPAKSGVFEGVFYDRQTTRVALSPEGVLNVVLPPSSVVGEYVVTIAKSEFTISIPDGVTEIDLTKLIGA